MPRTDIYAFLGLYTLGFIGYLWIHKRVASHHDFVFFIGVAIVARLGLIFVAPGLSDDLYRFFWDGTIAHLGFSPYEYTPSQMMDGNMVGGFLSTDIYPYLNSQDYYSIYPPLSQLIFQISTYFTQDHLYHSSIVLRVFNITADIGVIYLLMKLLPAMNFNQKNVLLYALNPLVILEFSANLHGEVIMLFFFLFAFWWLLKGRWGYFSVLFALGILTKLTILLLFPLFLKRLGWKNFILSGLLIAAIVLAAYGGMGLFVYLDNYLASLQLFFQRFEFNASFYYFFRYLGYQWKGYNMIHYIGPLLSIAAMGGYFFMYVLQYINNKGLLVRALFIYTIFLFASTTVHPWYIVFPLVFSLFSKYRYPVVWSFFIVFSYISYVSDPYSEMMAVVVIEYLLLGLVLLIEFGFIPAKWYFNLYESTEKD
ncbi:DUF2029 domain-containing protein [Membranihabitans marinus]